MNFIIFLLFLVYFFHEMTNSHYNGNRYIHFQDLKNK